MPVEAGALLELLELVGRVLVPVELLLVGRLALLEDEVGALEEEGAEELEPPLELELPPPPFPFKQPEDPATMAGVMAEPITSPLESPTAMVTVWPTGWSTVQT